MTSMTSFLKHYIVEVIAAAVIVALIAVSFKAHIEQRRQFKAVCDQANGTTVHDGRQLQCIKEVTHGR